MVGYPTNVNVIEPVLSKLLSGIDDESIKTSFSNNLTLREKFTIHFIDSCFYLAVDKIEII
jgi:hypothetical protein